MRVWEWVTAGLAIWGAVSILAAVFWALAGKRIFRKPPAMPMHPRTVQAIQGYAAFEREHAEHRECLKCTQAEIEMRGRK